MKQALIVVLIICAAGLGYRLLRGRARNQPSPGSAEAEALARSLDPRGMVIATAPQSDDRARRLLPTRGSEDVSQLLVRPRLPKKQAEGWGPGEGIEWIIDITTPQPGTGFKRDKVLGVFSRAWSEANDKNGLVNVYGRGAADKTWAHVHAVAVPEDYNQLVVGVEFRPGSGPPATAVELDRLARAVDVAAKQLGAVVTRARTPAKAAADRARELDSLVRELADARAVVLLAAPEGTTFDGKAIWDVMLCLGLRWGDMDEFHWENEGDSLGDDHFFSVSSSTAPGYFLPEEIAAGRLHVGNLHFDFSIPRSADPTAVLEAMLAAATYARKRLGGDLVDGEGADLQPDLLRKRVADITARLTKAGLPPGHEATMRLF